MTFINKSGFKNLSEEIEAVTTTQQIYLFENTYYFVCCSSASDPRQPRGQTSLTYKSHPFSFPWGGVWFPWPPCEWGFWRAHRLGDPQRPSLPGLPSPPSPCSVGLRGWQALILFLILIPHGPHLCLLPPLWLLSSDFRSYF